MKFSGELLYGTDKLPVNIETATPVAKLEPKEYPPSLPPEELVTWALQNPVDTFNFENFQHATSVAIAINDKTRPVPHEYMIPPLLSYLSQMGIKRECITFYVATGTHTPNMQKDFAALVPADILEGYRVVSHDCDDVVSLLDIGYTHCGTPVHVNKPYFLADLKIVIGNIEPHHFMGFSGGAKSAAIGLAGRDTINKNHTMLTNPCSRIGKYENNPMRQDVEEIGDMMGIHLALNVVLNSKKQIVKAYAGSPRSVMQAGIPFCREVCQVKVSRQYDIVLTSPGGHPKDINFYQAQKALTNAAQIVKDGGAIVLAAACPEGSGSNAFEAFMSDVKSPQDAIEKFVRLGFSVGPHKGYQIAQITKKAKVLLVSELPPELVKRFLMIPCSTIQEAVQEAIFHFPRKPEIAFMPKAVNTIPVLTENE
ncbi:MAG: nickel-dependent lactate racemase [Anaerolineaceae bacterium]|nr:nickel-dependent lactate racemase [Anaerolineaceae bacterium]